MDLLEQFDDIYSNMGCQLGDHGFSYLDATLQTGVPSGLIKDVPGSSNGVMLSFQINPGFAYNILMVASAFGGIEENARCQPCDGIKGQWIQVSVTLCSHLRYFEPGSLHL
ncbi:hypothetical protein TNCV_4845651 [Trichonephila clavipes]|uniref:Uncharacterized protein n=1 Tax=Trichonephila clavipes TaxID=2585209 RepID=A0A8X6WJC9_TRICX|nr:hypothetical protein TNCV_4845651 [Trichonephila clavipes]